MKNLFRFASYGCLVASMALVSCSDDNDGPDAPDNSTPAAPSVGNVFTAATPAQVDGYKFTINDKGQVTNIKDEWDDITIEYGTFTRATEYQGKATFKNDGKIEWEIYLQFNNQGFITNALQVYADSDEDDTWTFTYNADGQLNGMVRSESDEKYTVTYTDGNITKVKSTWEDGDYRETTISYTNDTHKTPVANKANVMLFDEIFDIDMDEMAPLYYAGLLGKATKNLPMKSDVAGKEGSDTYTDSYTFFWEFDSNDLPTKFWSKYGDETYNSDEVSFSWK